MKLFGRRREPVEDIVVPACETCGATSGEVLDRHRVTIVTDSVLANSTWPAERRERILAACPVCGLVTDLGHPTFHGAVGQFAPDGDGPAFVRPLGQQLVEGGEVLGDGAVLVDVIDSGPSWRSALLDPSIDDVHWFSVGSLARTLRRAGFGVRAIRILATGRLQAEAVAAGATSDAPFVVEESPDDLMAAIRYHVGRRTQLVDEQRHHIERGRTNGGVIGVWGATPTTVAFLDALDDEAVVSAVVSAVVDPDPAVGGQRIVGSELPIVTPGHHEVAPTLILVPDVAQRAVAEAHLAEVGQRAVVI